MKYFLTGESILKWLETPSVYHIKKDELYELDNESFEFLKLCSSEKGCASEQSEFIDYCMNERLLTKEAPSVTRPPLIKSPEPSLRYLELQITDRCNLRCRHCYIGDCITLPSVPSLTNSRGLKPGRGNIQDTSYQNKVNTHQPSVKLTPPALPPPLKIRANSRLDGAGGRGSYDIKRHELSLAQIKQILTEFEEMQGLRLMITGGEPLLHTNFDALNDILPDFFIRKVLFTNGLLLNKNLLAHLHVDEIQISIDGLEKAHDALRGEGTYNKAVRALRLAKELGFEVSVATMVHAKNLGDFDGMENLFSEIGIKDWTVDIPCITGRLKNSGEFQVSPEVGGKYLRYGYGTGLHTGEPGFGCGLHLLSVMADGKVTKCTFYADRPVGSINEGLSQCWERTRPVRLKDLACDCVYLETCRGGCRYRAELLGDPLGKDLYKCSFHDILENK